MATGDHHQLVLEYRRSDGRRSATVWEMVFGTVMIITGVISILLMVVAVVAKFIPPVVAAITGTGVAAFSFRFGYEMFRGSKK